jgi:hypothetical protein
MNALIVLEILLIDSSRSSNIMLRDCWLNTSQSHRASKWTLQAHTQPLSQAITVEYVAARQSSRIIRIIEAI